MNMYLIFIKLTRKNKICKLNKYGNENNLTKVNFVLLHYFVLLLYTYNPN